MTSYSDLVELHNRVKGRDTQQGSFQGVQVAELDSVWVCADQLGRAVLLLQHAPSNRMPAPLRLRNLEVLFGVSCVVNAEDGSGGRGVFAVLTCLDDSPAAIDFFWGAAASLLEMLGPNPRSDDIGRMAAGFADLFLRLSRGMTGPVLGLMGELLFMLSLSTEVERRNAVQSWHGLDSDPWDFVFPDCRVDVKATRSAGRVHEVSYAQTNPVADSVAYLVSIHLVDAGAGSTVGALMARLVRSIDFDSDMVSKVHKVCADTLGSELSESTLKIDVEASAASIRVYRADEVAGIRVPLPPGVTSLRYRSDFDVVGAWQKLADVSF